MKRKLESGILKSNKGKRAAITSGIFLLLIAAAFESPTTGFIAIFLICLGGFPKAAKFILIIPGALWNVFVGALYAVSKAVAKGINEGKAQTHKDS